MTRYIMRTAILLVLGFATPAGADTIHPYSDPLPFGNYVNDVRPIVESAFQRHSWRFSTRDDGTGYSGSLSFKGFEIDVEVTITGTDLVIIATSARESACMSNCADLRREPHVERWVANLRRTIAVDITRQVRDRLLAKASGG